MNRNRGKVPYWLRGALLVSLLFVPIGLIPMTSFTYLSAIQPIGTVPPVNATFEPPFTATAPISTAIPTIGPGQYFEEIDQDRLPEVARPDLLEDEDFGYSAILGEEDKYLVWSLNDEGMRHYYILDEASDYFVRIKTIVDINWDARRILDETNPLFSMIWAATKAVVGEIGFFVCGTAALASLEVPPIAGVFGGCALAAAGLFGASLDEYFDIANSVKAYENRTEADRKSIEGIFRELRAIPSP